MVMGMVMAMGMVMGMQMGRIVRMLGIRSMIRLPQPWIIMNYYDFGCLYFNFYQCRHIINK